MSKELADVILEMVKSGGASAVQIVLVIQVIGLLKTAIVMGCIAASISKLAGAIHAANS